MTAPAAPSAVLFDLDGTLIDSESIWMAKQAALASKWDVPWGSEDNVQLVGLHLIDAARFIAAKGVDLPPSEIVALLTQQVNDELAAKLPMRPGALDALQKLTDAEVPLALVTMSHRSTVEIVLAAFERTLGFAPFAATVTGDEVAQGKPAPEPYLRGLELLSVDADGAVAVEDSFPGVASALAAGLTTIGIPHNADVSKVEGIVVWQSLAGHEVADFAAATLEEAR